MNNNELERYQQQIIRKKRLELMIKHMLIEKDALAIKMNMLCDYLLLHDENLEEAKDISLSYMYYEMFERKHQRVHKDIREKFTYIAKYEMVYKEIEEINKDIAYLNKELSCLNGCEKRYLNMFLKKTSDFKTNGDIAGQKIMELDNKISYLNTQKREMLCAIEAGHTLVRSISSAKKGIDSVKSWGNKDLLNGDEVLLCKKRQYIDNTQKSLYRMQLSLRKFVVELNEVNISVSDQVVIYEFSNLVYNFYDVIFGDESLAKNIKLYSYQLKQIKEEVACVIKKVKERCMIIEEEIGKIERRKNEILTYVR